MIVRIWRTRIDETSDAEYRSFAHSKSLPMFRDQPGFAGVLFTGRRGERAVITLWRDLASVEALAGSETYKATVAELEATGWLEGESAVEVLALDEAFFEGAFIEETARS